MERKNSTGCQHSLCAHSIRLSAARADGSCKSRISNEAGRCQEVSSSFFASLNLFLFSIEHTRALAQERSFPRGIFFRRRSLFRVHPTRSAPYSFITAVWPTKHLFDPDGS